MKKSVHPKSKLGRRLNQMRGRGRRLEEEWTLQFPECVPELRNNGSPMSPNDRYLIGVTGDMTTPQIPRFSLTKPCLGIDQSTIKYSSRYLNQPKPWTNEVWFYPDTRQYRFNINDFNREGFLDMEMVASLSYFVVPTDCPLEEQTFERRIKTKDY